MLGQIIIALITIYIGVNMLGINTSLWLPGLDREIDIGAFYYALVLFVLVGTSNAVNLTDGLDGLAAGAVTIAALAYAVVCCHFGDSNLAVFCVAIAAACVAFLRFNHHPAQVFMGDTGSLALGGALAAVGILTHTELLLVIIGGVFVCEALSVIIQVVSFQTRGKRVFLMSPIHHHFELKGWPETRVVYTFCGVGAALAALALLLL
jgi:phospho-N-acetylmuramoyl-pentapeptide-transferase